MVGVSRISIPVGFHYLKNMAIYPKKDLRQAYIDDYGKDLKSKYDRVEKTLYKEKIFCLDCLDYKTCKGWKSCPYRVKALKIIKEEL